jgi:LemA protein
MPCFYINRQNTKTLGTIGTLAHFRHSFKHMNSKNSPFLPTYNHPDRILMSRIFLTGRVQNAKNKTHATPRCWTRAERSYLMNYVLGGNTMRKCIYLYLILIAGLVVMSGCGYNSMQQQEEAVMKAWGDVESTLQRRADLIPNLVEVVKGYATHEKETLQAVIDARAKATSVNLTAKDLGNPQAMQRLQEAQGQLSSALSRLMVVVERYPDLKANQNFMDLQNQLEGTENRITVARQRYNAAVEKFNFAIRKFPNSLTNSLMLHLERKEYFKADAAAQAAPKVDFGN